MSRADRITDILKHALQPSHLEVHDDSHKHAGHTGARDGGETHYRLVIESESFRDMGKVHIHQRIYKLLDKEFKTGLHALSIQAAAPKQLRPC